MGQFRSSFSQGMEGMEQVWNPETRMGRRSSIPPYLPYLFYQAHTHAHTRVRARARAHNHIIFSMEGMEVWKSQSRQGLQPSIPLPHLKEVWNYEQ